MKTLDLKKQLEKYYKQKKGAPATLTVPEFQFLMVDGQGDPNTSLDFRQAVEVLYSLSYTMKFMVKLGKQAVDYPVMPLEALWWADDMEAFLKGQKEKWYWTVMILQPAVVTPALHDAARAELRRKKKELPAMGKERLDCFTEGLSAQILHVGPYSTEGPTIQRLHEYIRESGGTLRGKHHEIYLGDPHRANPATLKTIIRQPMQL